MDLSNAAAQLLVCIGDLQAQGKTLATAEYLGALSVVNICNKSGQ